MSAHYSYQVQVCQDKVRSISHGRAYSQANEEKINACTARTLQHIFRTPSGKVQKAVPSLCMPQLVPDPCDQIVHIQLNMHLIVSALRAKTGKDRPVAKL